jgi:hypothetical protein
MHFLLDLVKILNKIEFYRFHNYFGIDIYFKKIVVRLSNLFFYSIFYLIPSFFFTVLYN